MKNNGVLLRRIPFTLIMLGGLILTALITNTYFDQTTTFWGVYLLALILLSLIISLGIRHMSCF